MNYEDPENRHPFDATQITGIANGLSLNLALGMRIEQAVQLFISTGLHPELVNAGRLEMEEQLQITRFRDLPPPIAVSPEVRRTSWYTGPMEGDVFWPPVHQRLLEQISPQAVESVHSSSDRIVSLLPPPMGTSGADYHARGLTLGYVQSGKTTNFISVIAKAADRGYRVFVVLSGITDALRNQTQERVNDLLIGNQTNLWYRLTTVNTLSPEGTLINGDFDTSPAGHSIRNAAVNMSSENVRFIAVVKKNVNRLRQLRDWLDAVPPELLRQRPILVIDDEADQASLNTARKERNQTRINGLITEINRNPKIAYVAYSATPFANLLQDPSPESPSSLYPKDFIVSLPRPEGYFGAEELFGRSDEGEGPNSEGLDIIRKIDDDEVVAMKPASGRGAVYAWNPVMHAGLREAIQWFIIATAARRARHQVSHHSTMLIHTSSLSEAHYRLVGIVKSELDSMSSLDEETLAKFRALYLREQQAVPASDFNNETISWNEVQSRIQQVVRESRIVMDNFRSLDRLVYGSESPETVIVVGGNTLSRGLTLEGLCSSYFVRSSSAYDTLLQMGRWFGYRSGYEDLCRIWIANDLATWFRDLSLVESEIRSDMQRYDVEELTPMEVGVRIRTHEKMRITALAKMRDADDELDLSFTGRPAQTTIFYDSADKFSWLNQNIEAVRGLFDSAKNREMRVRDFPNGNRGLLNVPSELISKFLTSYNIHPDQAKSIPKDQLLEYIDLENGAGSLQFWNVVVKEDHTFESRLQDIEPLDLGLGTKVGRRERRPLVDSRSGEANFRVMQSQGDRALDLEVTDREIQALSNTGSSGNGLSDRAILEYHRYITPTLDSS